MCGQARSGQARRGVPAPRPCRARAVPRAAPRAAPRAQRSPCAARRPASLVQPAPSSSSHPVPSPRPLVQPDPKKKKKGVQMVLGGLSMAEQRRKAHVRPAAGAASVSVRLQQAVGLGSLRFIRVRRLFHRGCPAARRPRLPPRSCLQAAAEGEEEQQQRRPQVRPIVRGTAPLHVASHVDCAWEHAGSRAAVQPGSSVMHLHPPTPPLTPA